ncbi:MAG: SxtJ family membrane protein [Candidatus Omnitrophica bacterium]|nr:SxtJ family membrane protein [Candidatus Omnitrophota bacterium]
MEKLNLSFSNLKKFAITMGVAFLVIVALIFLKHRHLNLPFLFISLGFFISAVVSPAILKPIYILWMRFAFILSWVNTRLLLLIIFYLVFTPISLILKLFGKDILERRIDRQCTSYWHQRENAVAAKDYERQF